MSKTLVEAGGSVVASEADGSNKLKIRIRIMEGNIQGSSGYYPADVLKRDAGIFAKGTHMHLDHMSFWEMMEGSPGSLATLAGFLDSDAVYETVDGVEGLYANAIVISEYAQFIKEVGSNIGVSILAAATVDEGISPSTGEPTDIITGFVGVRSVDFVTHPGANGRIIQQLNESAKELWNPGYQTGVKFIQSHPAIESAGETKKETKPMAELSEAAVKALEGLPALIAALTTAQEAATTAAAAAAVKEDEPQIDVVGSILDLTAQLTESGLPKPAVERVMVAIKGGVPATDAITAEKAYIETLTAAVKESAKPRAFGELTLVESAGAAGDDNGWLKNYGKTGRAI